MKIISSFLFAIAIFLFVACRSPKDQSPVFDLEHDLTTEQIDSFEHLFAIHKERTGNELALVTTPDYKPEKNIEKFSLRFANEHGIGEKEKNNGLLVCFSRAKHQVRISTGYGLENILTDDKAQKIIDSIMIPEFREDRTFEGLAKGFTAITEFLERPENKLK